MAILWDQTGLVPLKPGFPADLCVTGTAAVNTALTITLPAVAGMFHYLVNINIYKYYSVVGVAAAAPVVVTTTNLPGTLAFTFDQAASPQGTCSMQNYNFPGNPLKSLAANVATTIVCPQQLQTIWRATVWYYLGV